MNLRLRRPAEGWRPMQRRVVLEYKEALAYPVTPWLKAKQTNVDVYPVGIQYDLWMSSRMIRCGMWSLAAKHLRQMFRLLRQRVKRNGLRSLKLYLNGHLAEPAWWPGGLKRCGTGWTKGRALADLRRKMLLAGWVSRVDQ